MAALSKCPAKPSITATRPTAFSHYLPFLHASGFWISRFPFLQNGIVVVESALGMKQLFVLFGFAMISAYAAEMERFAFNDKKIPSGVEDLKAIQKSMQSVLEKVRAATVCVELGQGSGSGVIISEDGLILTAAHVTSGVGKEVTFVLSDGRRVKGESLGLSSDSDCAMAKITEKGPFPFVEVDKEDQSRLGDWVFSLGHSGGYNKDRGVGVRIGRIVKSTESTVQTDCSLIGGDSGGPLFDMHGRLIGIHSRVGPTITENMHVPTREFVLHWDKMLKGEFLGEGPFAKKPKKGTGFLGCGSEDREGKLVVTKIGRESPAEAAGIKVDDILIKLDGTEIKDKKHFQAMLAEKCADDKVTVVLLRAEKEISLTIKLAER